MNNKVITSDRLLGLEDDCPNYNCPSKIYSIGVMRYDDGAKTWDVGFWCPLDKEIIYKWREEWDELINDIINSTI